MSRHHHVSEFSLAVWALPLLALTGLLGFIPCVLGLLLALPLKFIFGADVSFFVGMYIFFPILLVGQFVLFVWLVVRARAKVVGAGC